MTMMDSWEILWSWTLIKLFPIPCITTNVAVFDLRGTYFSKIRDWVAPVSLRILIWVLIVGSSTGCIEPFDTNGLYSSLILFLFPPLGFLRKKTNPAFPDLAPLSPCNSLLCVLLLHSSNMLDASICLTASRWETGVVAQGFIFWVGRSDCIYLTWSRDRTSTSRHPGIRAASVLERAVILGFVSFMC